MCRLTFFGLKALASKKMDMSILKDFFGMRNTFRRFSVYAILLCLIPIFVSAEYQIRISKTDLSADPSLPEPIWNILLIGTDVWEDIPDEGRSDAMVVSSYNAQTGEVRLVSLARDLLVNIPASAKNRLNAAHSLGGPNLLMKTINETFGLNITRYASINIYGVRRIIDAVGGVRLHITEREATSIHRMISIEFPREDNPDCPYGDCILSGLQAMTYARIRDLDNDFGRIERQQAVLRALAERVSELSEEDRGQLIAKVLPEVSTNLSFADILAIGSNAISHGVHGLKMYRLPVRGTYIFDHYNGMSVILAETKRLKNDMKTLLYGD